MILRPLVLALGLLPLALIAQNTFPSLQGETSDGRTIDLPKAATGKNAIIAVAYGKKAEPLLADWYEPAYLRFVAKHGLFAAGNDVELFFVPMFVGLNKAAYEGSMKKLRKTADPDVARRVVFYKGEGNELIEKLGMKEKDEPHFFVLDAEGRIIHRSKGAFTDAKLDAMEEALMD